jgi:hypothetical protein
MIRRSKQRSTRALDINALREALADGRVWTAIGRVSRFDGEPAHFEIFPASAGERADVIVDVELFPQGERVACRLAGAGALWAIPPVGAEVAVLVPTGDYEADPIIVGVLGFPGDGLAESTVIIVAPQGGQVLIHDGASGDAQALALKSDVQAIKDAIADAVPTANDGGAALQNQINAALTNYPVGTSTLRAK